MAGLITAVLTFDKAAYNPGDLITATIKCSAVGPATVENDPVSGALKDAAGDDVTVTGTVQVSHPGVASAVTVTSVVSAAGRVFAQKSFDGSTWVGTAVA